MVGVPLPVIRRNWLEVSGDPASNVPDSLLFHLRIEAWSNSQGGPYEKRDLFPPEAPLPKIHPYPIHVPPLQELPVKRGTREWLEFARGF